MGTFTDALFSHLGQRYASVDESSVEDTACADAMVASLTPYQQYAWRDPCQQLAVICPRRAGKSHLAMVMAFDKCLRKTNARVVVVTLTLKHAKNIYWYDMHAFADKFGIQGARFYQNELRIIFRNGSQLMLIGAESRAEIEKLRGGQYDLVVVDECKSYPDYILSELIYEVIFPALADRSGRIMLIGTPGSVLRGLFFETTYPGWTSEDTGRPRSRSFHKPEQFWLDNPDNNTYWSRHSWTVQDNVAMPHLWDEMLKRKELAGWADDEPIWLREALGMWVASDNAFVYAYPNLAGDQATRQQLHWHPNFKTGNQFGLPVGERWRYLLGVDLGYRDHTALAVGAYNPHDGVLHHVWEHSEAGMDTYRVIDLILEANERFGGFGAIVMDVSAGGKQLIETLNKHHGLSIKDAEKQHKFDFIELQNADTRAGRIKYMANSELTQQMSLLQYDLSRGQEFSNVARKGKLAENPSQANDLCDAWLYLWRYSYHHWQSSRIAVVEPGSPEHWAQVRRNDIESLLRQRRQAQTGNPNDPLRDRYLS